MEVPLRIFDERLVIPETISIPHVRMTNVVAKFSLSRVLVNFDWIVHMLPGFTFSREKLSEVVVYMDNVTMRVFAEGCVNSVGAKTVAEARICGLRLCNLFLQLGEVVTMTNFSVDNVTFATQIGFPIDIKKLELAYSLNVTNHDTFPGINFRFNDTSVTLTLFTTGTCNIVGCKTYQEAYHCWSWFYTFILTRFKHTIHSHTSSLIDDLDHLHKTRTSTSSNNWSDLLDRWNIFEHHSHTCLLLQESSLKAQQIIRTHHCLSFDQIHVNCTVQDEKVVKKQIEIYTQLLVERERDDDPSQNLFLELPESVQTYTSFMPQQPFTFTCS